MSTPAAPPAPPQSPAPPPPGGQTPGGRPPGRGVARAVSAVAVVLGAVVLVTGVVGAASSTVRDASRVDDDLAVSTEGVSRLDVEAAATRVDVAFGDVEQAELAVRGSRGQWQLERDGDLLRVTSPDGSFGGWALGWSGDQGRATLTLPAELGDGALDASFDVGGGELRATGAYGAVQVDVGAGGVVLDGAATSLDVDVAAGELEVDVTGVEEAGFDVAAGSVVAALGGTTAPRSVAVDVSAGSLELALPAQTYALESDVAAGTLEESLDTSPAAASQIEVSLAAGTVVLRENG
ncbi:hypothetical protein [uncultured Pseudokineococcus sp.]|uniref:hypothetical protein n=1 Tax=uncultured Pseudokineococcus sp. TaxID=1642928 RepID=UPI0026024C70|nr:hypothetical protein [uncultured Pseudokineococcus sp.]